MPTKHTRRRQATSASPTRKTPAQKSPPKKKPAKAKAPPAKKPAAPKKEEEGYDGSTPLKNPMNEAFVQALLGQGPQRNVTAAYLKAIEPEEVKRTVAGVMGWRLLKNVNICRRIRWEQEQAAEVCILEQQQKIGLLTKAVYDCSLGIGQFCTMGPDGEQQIEFNEDMKQSLAIKGITTRMQFDVCGDEKKAFWITKLEFRDFLPYLAELNKMMPGALAARQLEASGKDGGPIPIEDKAAGAMISALVEQLNGEGKDDAR